MSDPASKVELMRSLARLVRGLSALFWGLPLALVVGVQTAQTDWLGAFGMFPILMSTGLLLYGLMQLAYFQRQERIWIESLDRAKLLALINLGLSPFVYWWHKSPEISYFSMVVGVLALSGLLFLFDLNHVLHRLTAMLPHETLRHETKVFTTLNSYLVLLTIVFLTAVVALNQLSGLPRIVVQLRLVLDRGNLWFSLFLVLFPLAMTMALIWKIKETVLDGVYGAES